MDQELAEVEAFETGGRATLSLAHDNRHVVAVQTAENKVNILDAGSWASGHGDHFHFYVADPVLVDEAIEGGKPVHVVANAEADTTAIFFDDEGEAVVLDDEVLTEQHFHDLDRITTDGPQHGLAMPLPDDKWLVTQPGADGALPATIELRTDDAAVEDTFTCVEMHGEDVVGNVAAFGCGDSILMVEDGQATTIPNPDESGDRVGGLLANADASTFVGDWGPTSLVFINDGAAEVVDLGVEYGNRAVTPDGRFAVLGTDGTLRILDSSGEKLQEFEVTQEWSVPEGHGGLAPSITGADVEGANTIYVTEPGANKVHAVDLFSNEVTSTELEGEPSSIVVTNAS